jgi:hypothetical protein
VSVKRATLRRNRIGDPGVAIGSRA